MNRGARVEILVARERPYERLALEATINPSSQGGMNQVNVETRVLRFAEWPVASYQSNQKSALARIRTGKHLRREARFHTCRSNGFNGNS